MSRNQTPEPERVSHPSSHQHWLNGALLRGTPRNRSPSRTGRRWFPTLGRFTWCARLRATVWSASSARKPALSLRHRWRGGLVGCWPLSGGPGPYMAFWTSSFEGLSFGRVVAGSRSEQPGKPSRPMSSPAASTPFKAGLIFIDAGLHSQCQGRAGGTRSLRA